MGGAIEEYKIVPIYAGRRIGRTMTPRTAANRDKEAFLELWNEMCKQAERVRAEQLSLFDDAKT